MKVLIVTGGVTLTEVTEAELEAIYVASGEGDIVLATNSEEAAEHWPDAEVALASIDREIYLSAQNLRWLQNTAAGADMLMFPEMVNGETLLTGDKGLVGEHLADHAFGLLLVLTRQLKRAILEAPNSWPSRPAMRRQMIELTGLTLGIIGLGGTGRSVAKRARAFGMNVIAVDLEDVAPDPNVGEFMKMDRFHELLGRADVVTVCAPLTPLTRNLLNDEAFAAMRDGSYVLNVTRGPIIDGDALVRALQSGHLAGAGLDVTPIEPLPADHPLWSFPNVVITPHAAGASQFRARRNVARFIDNLRRYRANQPLDGLIDKQKGF